MKKEMKTNKFTLPSQIQFNENVQTYLLKRTNSFINYLSKKHQLFEIKSTAKKALITKIAFGISRESVLVVKLT